MPSAAQTAPVSKKRLWAGRIISALAALFMLFNGIIALTKTPSVLQGLAHLGYPERVAIPIGTLMIVCTVVYAIPRTSALGAILLTGYLGAATASHVRIGEPFWFPLLFAVLIWAGLFLRDDRLRALIPLRTSP